MSFESPLSVLFDSKGVELAVSNSQQLDPSLSGSATAAGLLMAGSGSDGKVRFLRTTDAGDLFITGTITTVGGNNDQGNHGTPDQSWYVVLTDGTSSAALGSAASTPIFITGTVNTEGPAGTSADPVFVTGTITVEVDTVNQGNHGTPDQSWYTVITDGTSSAALGSAAGTPLFVTGTFNQEGPDGSSADPIFVTGSVAILEQPVQVTGTIQVEGADGTALDPVHVTGSVAIEKNINPNATVTQVAASATAVTLAAANAARCGLILYYAGAGPRTLWVKFGTAASATDYTVRMTPNSYYEVPANYTGIVTGIWNNTGGSDAFVQVTEVTD